MNIQQDEPLENLDALLNKLGIYGRFQFIIFFGLRFMYFAFTFSILQMAYAGMTPSWYCITSKSDDAFQSFSFDESVEAEEKISGLVNNFTASSIIHEIILGNKSLKVCSINGTICDSFKFIGSSRTIVTEWNLVCDRAWIKQIIVSIQMAGILTGSLLVGQLGDRFGRRNALYSALLVCSVSDLVAGISISWEMFAICKFLVGNALGGLSVAGYPYLLEFSPQIWRPFIAGFPSFSIGACIFAGAAYALDDWSSLHLTSAAFIASFLLGWFYFPESPRWLAVHNKLNMAHKSLERIARCNRKPLPPGTTSLIAKIAREEKDIRQTGRMYTFYDIFSTCQIATVTVSMSYISCSLNIVIYGIAYGISALHGNVFLNIFLMAILQIPVQLTSSYIVHRFGRRRSTFLYTLLAAIGSAGCLIFTAQELSSKGAIISGLCIMTRIAVGVSYNIAVLWCNELYPTVVRSLGHSFCNGIARFGGILTPFLVNFDGMAMPSYAIITFLLVTSGLLTLILQERNNVPLAESAARTRNFNSHHDICMDEGTSELYRTPVASAKF